MGKSIRRARFDPSKARGASEVSQPGLFEPKSDKPLSVSQLTRIIKRTIEDNIPQRVLVAGEISNLKRPTSGHMYLVLKDANSQIPAVMWKSKAAKLLGVSRNTLKKKSVVF